MDSTSFIEKLYAHLKATIPFSYPDKSTNELPDFTETYSVNNDFYDELVRWNEIKKRLIEFDLKALENTYQNLSDNYSKDILIFLIIYKVLGNSHFRFPFYYSYSFEKLPFIESLAVDQETITLWYDIIKLKKHDLSKLGYDLLVWSVPAGIILEFVVEQYNYRNLIRVENDDVVFDCGACYGDTALHFASNTSGKVYSFEFLPENIDIFKKNLQLNPKVSDRVILTESPLGAKSGENVFAVSNGPGTNTNASSETEQANCFVTTSIDDFVMKNNIEKVDFIKMDVEGSEENILKGAINTIRRFKPKLAVCAYHKEDDLIVLPQVIKEIVPEYKLYLKHNTCMNNETVLFASIK